jgi:hypothetical protein
MSEPNVHLEHDGASRAFDPSSRSDYNQLVVALAALYDSRSCSTAAGGGRVTRRSRSATMDLRVRQR